jgi:radical SAM superfamily enzyme YgiQ (UPF0313 family)
MKITLVYPSIYISGFNAAGKDAVFDHIHPGLCYLSAACKHEGFTDIELVDLRTMHDWHHFRRKIEESHPDVVGVTMMSPDYNYAMECINIVKDISPEIKTIVGGYHPTIMTNELLQNSKVDHIVTGEGEVSLPQLLRKIASGAATERVIKGEFCDIDRLPFPDRELFNCLESPYDFFLPLPFFTVLAGRGCSYNCNFCSPAGKLVHGYRMRRRSVDNVIEELKYLDGVYGFRSLQFWDDCFTESKDWVIEFCHKYRKAGFTQNFVCQTRADIVCKNPEMMKELKRAGLAMASIGFESGNDRILKFINKGTTLKQNLAAARLCKRLGIKIWAYHMFGIPTETNKEAWDTVRMIKRIKPYRSSAAFFTPHPGSNFYNYCKKNNLSLIDDHDAFVRLPEVDRPKIKNIDYDAMRNMATISKDAAIGVKIRIRIERIFAHKRRKAFEARFKQELERKPGCNKLAVLRLAHKEGRI